MKRKIEKMAQGQPTTDGAGVHLVRVLGAATVEDFDPFHMLDSFDSTDPADYEAGFPLHPHRGIETISYLAQGNMVHEDTVGNKDQITDGEVQWMNAGSGVEHSEMLPASPRMLGVQLWLNLPADQIMSLPSYRSIKKEEIEEILIEGGKLRLLAGKYKDHVGYQGDHLPLTYYELQLAQGQKLTLPTEEEDMVMLFTLLGEIEVNGERIPEKTAVKLGRGTELSLKSQSPLARILFLESRPLHEPVAWAGPIVMNREEEIRQAFQDLRNGEFIKDRIDYE